VIERQADEELFVDVTLQVAFSLVSADDGSCHVVETYGEALDSGDKGTAKAMSAAYKSAMIQTFCIPVGDLEDADATSHSLAVRTHAPEPVQGWEQWARDIQDIVAVCESERAIDAVQGRNRELLKALSRERSELYEDLGECFTERRHALRRRSKPAASKSKKARAASSNELAEQADV